MADDNDTLITIPPSAKQHPPPKKPASSAGIITKVIQLLTYLASVPLLGYGLWLVWSKNFDCADELNIPHDYRFIFGILLLLLFVSSCLFTYYNRRMLRPGAICLAFFLLVSLILGIVLLGKFQTESRGLPVSPMWVRIRVARSDTWTGVKNCIYRSAVCRSLAYRTIELNADQFRRKGLSPIESGCCKPPNICGMEYVNATFWNVPKEEVSPIDGKTVPTNSTVNFKTFGDCQAYSNIDTQLCYDCESCKEGFVEMVHQDWKKLGQFLIPMSVILLAIHTVRFVLGNFAE